MITPGPELYSWGRRIYSHPAIKDAEIKDLKFVFLIKKKKSQKSKRELGWGGRITKEEFSELPCPHPLKL